MGMMRRRRRRRLLVAGAATGAVAYHAGKKNAEQEPLDETEQSEQATPEYAQAPQESGPDAGDLEEIEKLAGLHDSGALTDEEFAAAKAKLLA